MSFATQIGAAVIAVGLVGPTLYAALDRDPPIEKVETRADPYRVPVGGTLMVRWTYWKTRVCAVAVDEQIVDSDGTRHHIGTFTTDGGPELGHFENVVTHTDVPEDASFGKALYYRYLRYQCNPVQMGWPIRVEVPPVEFEIVPPTQGQLKWMIAPPSLDFGSLPPKPSSAATT